MIEAVSRSTPMVAKSAVQVEYDKGGTWVWRGARIVANWWSLKSDPRYQVVCFGQISEASPGAIVLGVTDDFGSLVGVSRLTGPVKSVPGVLA